MWEGVGRGRKFFDQELAKSSVLNTDEGEGRVGRWIGLDGGV